MMGKTHLAVGIASALLVAQPKTLTGCAVSVIGGAIGGTLSDVDLFDQENHHALKGQLLGVGLAILVFVLDRWLELGLFAKMLNPDRGMASVSGIAFAVLWILGVKSAHRSFTHSILGLILFSFVIKLLFPSMALSFSAAFVSHLILDFLNKKDLRLFYPLRTGVSLGLCYADRWANQVFLRLGTVLSVVLLIHSILGSIL